MAPAPSPDTARGLAPLPGGQEASTPSTAPLPAGTLLSDGRYELGAPLGRGGFGVTYAATDTRLQRPVAVKELLPEGASRRGTEVHVPEGAEPGFAAARQRFLREATTLARFGHPNIVRIFATFEENGTAYLVLERLVGRSLAAELRARRGPLTEAEALEVAGQVAAALAAVHRAGVLHRDVSPANLIRTDDGRTVLIDFGLARPFVADHTTMMTRIVTPGYAPPEQHAGAGRFSARADVYALGATLHRLLSGHTPTVAPERRAGTELTPLWRLNPTVSRRTSDAVAAALALDPADRPASVIRLLDRLGIDREGLDLDGVEDDDVAEEPADDDLPTALAAPSAAADALRPTVVVGPGAAEAAAAAIPPAPPPPRPAPPPPRQPAPVAAEAATAYAPAVEAIGRSPRPGDEVGATATEVPHVDHSDSSWRPDERPTAAAVPTEPLARGAVAGLAGAGAGTGAAGGPGGGSWHVPAPPGAEAVAPPAEADPHARHHRRATDPQPPAVLGTPAGRRWVTLPLGLAAVGLCSAQPVTLTLVLGLVVAPILATVGDVLAQPERSPAWAPLWWLRNIAIGFVRSLGAIVILAIGLCLWFGTDSIDALADAAPWVLRVTGIAAGAVLSMSIARGGSGFRSHVAVDALARKVCPHGKITVAAVVVALIGVGIAAAGFAFQPEAYPLG